MSRAWTSETTPILFGSHHQPARLVHAGWRRSSTTGDRLTNLEGLGTLGRTVETDFGFDEQAPDLEKDTDWAALVGEIVKTAGQVAAPVLATYTAKLRAKGASEASIAANVGAAQGRAQAVAAGQAPMPSAVPWTAIAIGGAGLLAALVFLMGRR